MSSAVEPMDHDGSDDDHRDRPPRSKPPSLTVEDLSIWDPSQPEDGEAATPELFASGSSINPGKKTSPLPV